MNKKPKFFDVFILSCFTVLITFQPYLLHHEIIMMETGIHLPGVQAFLRGGIPYKDFFYLRGPLEFYLPAYAMKWFGVNMIWLPIFYYAGTVLTLLCALWMGFQLYRTRLVLYLMVPVLVARTFPRISFYYWGGLRYALGLLALICAVEGFKNQNKKAMVGAGIVSGLAFWTTIESGVCTVFAIGVTLMFAMLWCKKERRQMRQLFLNYGMGVLAVMIPVIILMGMNGSLLSYVHMTYVVLTKSYQTFMNGPDLRPIGIDGFMMAMIPGAKFFKHLTPVYFYILLAGYLAVRMKRNPNDIQVFPLISIALFGILYYVTGFRRLDGHHFEMALQPEKILYFFILEEVFLKVYRFKVKEKERVLVLTTRGWQRMWASKGIYFVWFLLAAFIGSSLGYAFSRYSKRFVAAKIAVQWSTGQEKKDLSFLKDVPKRPVRIERARGMVVPLWQAEEMEGIVEFIQKNTRPDEEVFSYPEVGNFNFWADRPFIGRFPVATFSWMDDQWHQELLSDLQKSVPRYVIMTNLGHRTFPEEWYFRNPVNIEKFKDITNFVLSNYTVVKKYESVSIYARK